MITIIIAGAGGFGKEIAWVIRRANGVSGDFELAGFCDDDLSKAAGVREIAPFLGTLEEVQRNFAGSAYICAVGNNKIRARMMEGLDCAGLEAVSIVDPTAVVADNAIIGRGCFVGAHTVVSAGCRVGSGVIINHNVTVGHDAVIEDYAQLCPGVSLSGGCVVGKGALLGSNSCTLPGLRLGAWSTLGAGAVLLTDLEENGSRVRVR